MKTTKQWSQYWRDRKINWTERYMNWDHPHRFMISAALHQFPWMSLLEIGCAAGANLVNIVKHHKNKQLGGIDVSADAIEAARQTFQNAHFRVGSAEDLMFSDSSCDVILSDMCLIYIGPRKIDRAIDEIKRVARTHVLLCEFHHPSLLKRLKLWWTSGYYAYDYKKLLEKHGFYDILTYKIPPELWPGGEPQKTYGYLIRAKVPKRK